MESQELRRKEEIEKAKAKIKDAKHMQEETLSRIQKLQDNFKEDKQQYSKKLKNLKNVQASQNLRLSKVSSELKSIETVLQTRKAEENGLLQIVGNIKEELAKIKEETKNMVFNFQKTFAELEDDIQVAWVQLENDREAEAMMELGLSSLKMDDQIPVVENLFKIRKRLALKRQEELEKELSMIEEAQRNVGREIKSKTEELTLLKDKHSSLTKVYEMSKKAKQKHRENVSNKEVHQATD